MHENKQYGCCNDFFYLYHWRNYNSDKLVIDGALVYPGNDSVDLAGRQHWLSIRHTVIAGIVPHISHQVAVVGIYLKVDIAVEVDTSAAGCAAVAMTGITVLLQDRDDLVLIADIHSITWDGRSQFILALF